MARRTKLTPAERFLTLKTYEKEIREGRDGPVLDQRWTTRGPVYDEHFAEIAREARANVAKEREG